MTVETAKLQRITVEGTYTLTTAYTSVKYRVTRVNMVAFPKLQRTPFCLN